MAVVKVFCAGCSSYVGTRVVSEPYYGPPQISGSCGACFPPSEDKPVEAEPKPVEVKTAKMEPKPMQVEEKTERKPPKEQSKQEGKKEAVN